MKNSRTREKIIDFECKNKKINEEVLFILKKNIIIFF